MVPRIVAIGTLTLALAACGGGREVPQPEFVGRTLQVETRSGQTSTLSFRRDGEVTARFGERATEGRWRLDKRRLCFIWAGDFRECWPYTAPFRRGRTTTITSDRGNVVKVTMR
jgi:hypothetical protein